MKLQSSLLAKMIPAGIRAWFRATICAFVMVQCTYGFHRGMISTRKQLSSDKFRLRNGAMVDDAGHRNFIDKLDKEADDFIAQSRSTSYKNARIDHGPVQVPVEDTVWSGQSNVERRLPNKRNWGDLTARFDLVLVDSIALLLFAVIGRSSHNAGANPIADIQTAAPFLAGWFALAPLFGAYTSNATASNRTAAIKLLPAWIVGIPGGLALRGLARGAVPPVPFIVVSMVSTYLALLLGRCGYIALAGSTSDEESRPAGILEVFTMIRTLLRRW